MRPKWIFFDLDNTLFDFSRASLESLRRLWDEEVQIKTPYASAESFIDEFHIHNSLMWQLHEQGKISANFLKSERFRLTLWPDCHDARTVKNCERLNDRYLFHLGNCDMPVDGVKELLQELSKRHLIGIITNGFREVQYRKMKTTGLDRYIQRMIISDEIGIQKPDQRIFRFAEQATGAEPGTSLMIGDNPVSDIKGALDAGWSAIYFNRTGASPLSASSNLIAQCPSMEDVGDSIAVKCQS